MPKKPSKGNVLSLVPAIATVTPPLPSGRNLKDRHLSTAEVAAIANFERALGGRLKLLEILSASTELTEELAALFPYLGDPRFDKTSLAEICHAANLRPGDVFRAFKDATLSRANILAIQYAAERLPEILADMTEQALKHTEVCTACNGEGFIRGDVTKDDPEPAAKTCRPCNGRGEITVKADFAIQKTLLEVTGLLTKPGMAIGIQNTTIVPGQPSRGDSLGGLEQLQQAVSSVIYGRRGSPPAPAPPAEPTVDAEILPLPTPVPPEDPA